MTERRQPVGGRPTRGGNRRQQFSARPRLVELEARTVPSTSIPLSPNNWTALGPVIETSPGNFQFTDASAQTQGPRFYRVQSP